MQDAQCEALRRRVEILEAEIATRNSEISNLNRELRVARSQAKGVEELIAENRRLRRRIAALGEQMDVQKSPTLDPPPSASSTSGTTADDINGPGHAADGKTANPAEGQPVVTKVLSPRSQKLAEYKKMLEQEEEPQGRGPPGSLSSNAAMPKGQVRIQSSAISSIGFSSGQSVVDPQCESPLPPPYDAVATEPEVNVLMQRAFDEAVVEQKDDEDLEARFQALIGKNKKK